MQEVREQTFCQTLRSHWASSLFILRALRPSTLLCYSLVLDNTAC